MAAPSRPPHLGRRCARPALARGAWALLCVAGLAGCVPPGGPGPLDADAGDAARDVVAIAFVRDVAQRDKFVLRPDELGGIAADPARGLIYVGLRSGELLALRDVDGELVWELRENKGAIASTPLLTRDGARLLVGTDDGALIAVDLDARKVAWQYQTEGTVRAAPVEGEGVVYFTNSRQQVFALDLRDGQWRWQYQRELPAEFTVYGRAGLALRADVDGESAEVGTLYTGFDDGRVVAIGASSGEALWITSVAPEGGGRFIDADATPIVDEARGELVVAGAATGVIGLDLGDGRERWRRGAQGVNAVVAGPGGTWLAASSLEGMFAVEPGGRVRWRKQFDPGVLSAPTVVGDVAFVAHLEQGIFAFDARTGELLTQVETGSGVGAAPSHDVRGGRLYALSNRGQLVALDLADELLAPAP